MTYFVESYTRAQEIQARLMSEGAQEAVIEWTQGHEDEGYLVYTA